MANVLVGDCLAVMPTLPESSVDAIVTDPPYGLSFMGKEWDHGVPGTHFWVEALRVAKPGAHLVAFGGTRTYHRLACAIEDAGWEIRDCLSWLYGSGFPKSLDVSKALDKAAGVDANSTPAGGVGFMNNDREDGYHPTINRLTRKGETTPQAKRWDGWGTALKPAWEPIILARKPLIGTVAANVTAHGTGGLNIDGCRIEGAPDPGSWTAHRTAVDTSGGRLGQKAANIAAMNAGLIAPPSGRWPANVVLDEEAGKMLDAQSGDKGGGFATRGGTQDSGIFRQASRGTGEVVGYGDNGGASRFFLNVKADVCECAKSAEPSSSPPSRPGGSAPNDAAIADSREGKPLARSRRGRRSTPASGPSTPLPSPVSGAAGKANTDTTPTTPTFCGSCGCARPAIGASTSPVSEAVVAVVNVQVSGTRFLYSAKASRSEREAGLEGEPGARGISPNAPRPSEDAKTPSRTNHHPTVKPITLMRWLCRLVTPPNGLILDPFTGSGTTGCAAVLEGFDFIGIEQSPEYAAIAEKRIAHHTPSPTLPLG